jgi:hypothetical protein
MMNFDRDRRKHPKLVQAVWVIISVAIILALAALAILGPGGLKGALWWILFSSM